jgi:hypothetical protein
MCLFKARPIAKTTFECPGPLLKLSICSLIPLVKELDSPFAAALPNQPNRCGSSSSKFNHRIHMPKRIRFHVGSNLQARRNHLVLLEQQIFLPTKSILHSQLALPSTLAQTHRQAQHLDESHHHHLQAPQQSKELLDRFQSRGTLVSPLHENQRHMQQTTWSTRQHLGAHKQKHARLLS